MALNAASAGPVDRMSLEDAYYISQIVAAVAILASLIYAGLQFRIFARQAREARLAAYTSDIQQFRQAILADRDVARIYRDGLVDFTKLDPLDQWRFGALMQNLTQSMTLQLEFKDILPAEDITAGWEWIVCRPGYRTWWSRAKHLYGGPTRKLVEDAHARADAMAARTVSKGTDA